ncbi:MAG: NIPSNAP family protein [Candidatus Anammoximicrobium sp.]|nr:NIPSNAP family protein [Candidatus Anammoximicrobium sp.]
MTTKRVLVMAVVLGIAAVSAAAAQENRVFELRTYFSPPGRLDDLQARFRQHTVKLFSKHGMTNIGYWLPIDNPDNKLVYLLAYPSREAREASWKAFFADADWQAVKRNTEANGPIVTKVESVLLGPTDYSPVVKPEAAGERVFELRIYTASAGNLDNLNARFRNHTVQLFQKHGMTNVGYWNPLEGQPGAGQTLIYILAHRSLDAAQASFAAFRQDPDWLAARQASEDKAGGSLTVKDGVKSVYLKATDFSPMR